MCRKQFVPMLGLAALCLQLALACPVSAQDVSRPWWNPFASGTESTTSGSMQSQPVDSKLFNGGGKSTVFKLPEWKMPSLSKKPAKKSQSNSPSMFSRMGSTSKRWWDNTVDFVNPFNDGQPKFEQGYQPQNLNKTTKSGSGPFGRLWREEVTESPTNVNDFLRQDSPRF